MPVYSPDFVGPVPTGAFQRGADGVVFIVLHRPAPNHWWLLAHGLPTPEDSA
jgi:hypothetical protein